jgi:hypothetical protein
LVERSPCQNIRERTGTRARPRAVPVDLDVRAAILRQSLATAFPVIRSSCWLKSFSVAMNRLPKLRSMLIGSLPSIR